MPIDTSGKPGDTVGRFGFLMNAIDAFDSNTVAAVLGAPAYLSGLTRENQQVLKRRWHEVTRAPTFKKLKAHEAGLALLKRKGGLVQIVLEKAVGTLIESGRVWTPAQLWALRSQSAKSFGQVGG